jgi:hypothetical protein
VSVDLKALVRAVLIGALVGVTFGVAMAWLMT